MNNNVKKQAIDIITIGLNKGAKQIAPPDDDAIYNIDGLKASLEDKTELEATFFDDFFKNNFTVLINDQSSDVTQENFFQIQSKVTLLRKIQIELIEFVDRKTLGVRGDEIMGVFQNSSVYKQYFGEHGIDAKLKAYKEEHLAPIPAFDVLINIKGSLPNLEIKGSKVFADIAEGLKNYITNLKKYSKNLQFATLESNEENLNKIKMITLKSDPLILAMMTKTENSEKIQIEIEKQSFGSKAGKFLLTSLLLGVTAAIACIITGLAAPAIVTALGGTFVIKSGVGLATTAVMTGVGAVSKIVGNKIDKIGNKKETDSTLLDIVDKIQGIKIEDALSKGLLQDFNIKPKNTNNVILSLKKETNIRRA